MSVLYQAKSICRSFPNGNSSLEVLQNIDIEIEHSTMSAIVGASGSGKTTLLQILGTLDKPTAGEIFFQNEKITDRSEKELARFRNRSLGFIFQFHHLLPEFTTLENVLMPVRISGEKVADFKEMALELLERVELKHRLNHKVTDLSGGEQQRTALARALIMNPALLLADEPTGNLDSRSGGIVFSLLKELSSERGLATVMVTHNEELAGKMNRQLLLQEGKLQT